MSVKKMNWITAKYKQFISKIQWNIDNNSIQGDKLETFKKQLAIYREFVGDLEAQFECDKAQLSAPNTGKVDEWIRVEDELPAVSDNPIYLAAHTPRYEGDFYITQCGFSSIDAGIWPNVTHWRPLPTLPVLTQTKQ